VDGHAGESNPENQTFFFTYPEEQNVLETVVLERDY
jgi:hypothetical protein